MIISRFFQFLAILIFPSYLSSYIVKVTVLEHPKTGQEIILYADACSKERIDLAEEIHKTQTSLICPLIEKELVKSNETRFLFEGTGSMSRSDELSKWSKSFLLYQLSQLNTALEKSTWGSHMTNIDVRCNLFNILNNKKLWGLKNELLVRASGNIKKLTDPSERDAEPVYYDHNDEIYIELQSILSFLAKEISSLGSNYKHKMYLDNLLESSMEDIAHWRKNLQESDLYCLASVLVNLNSILAILKNWDAKRIIVFSGVSYSDQIEKTLQEDFGYKSIYCSAKPKCSTEFNPEKYLMAMYPSEKGKVYVQCDSPAYPDLLLINSVS